MIKHPVRTAALVMATAIGGGALAATPAQAEQSYDARAISALNVRYGPSTATKSTGSVQAGHSFVVVCKVRGTMVDGNDLWYLLPPTLNEWVSARYVQNIGAAPDWCGTSQRFAGQTTGALTQRTGPTTLASSSGTLSKGARVQIVCKLPGQSINGNTRWYYLSTGRWVAAAYVANVGAAPGWCN